MKSGHFFGWTESWVGTLYNWGWALYTAWNLNGCRLIFRTNLHYSDPSTSGWSLEVKFLSVITARVLELHHRNLLNILSNEDMISMMLNHMVRYVCVWKLVSFHVLQVFFSCCFSILPWHSELLFNCGTDAWWCWFWWCHCRGSYWSGLCRSVLMHVLKINFGWAYLSKPIVVLQFIQVLQRELNAVEKDKDAFIEDFSEVHFPL